MSSKLSSEEISQRQTDVNIAIASFELEGYTMPEGFVELYDAYIYGEKTLDEVGELVDQFIKERTQ